MELDFNAGKLYGADTKESLESRRIWSRSIGGTVGAESLFPQRASGSGILAFTGNRAWIESLTAYNSRLFEGSTLVKEVPDSLQDGDVSGPYLLTSGDVNGDWVYQVKRTDGAVVWTLSSTVAASTALFGSPGRLGEGEWRDLGPGRRQGGERDEPSAGAGEPVRELVLRLSEDLGRPCRRDHRFRDCLGQPRHRGGRRRSVGP